MKPNLRFSLVIPCLSDPKILRQTLDSVAAQQFPLDRFEVIVVDDCSPASLESIVAHYQGETGGRATFLRNETNLGRASSRNHGIQVASGEILVFLDVDQILEPEYLSALDEEFGENLKQSIRGNLAVWPTLLESSAFLRFYNSRLLGQRSAKEMEAIDIARLPPKYWASTSISMRDSSTMDAKTRSWASNWKQRTCLCIYRYGPRATVRTTA
jgi:glycosyltransferase involved in cell wall biosynthesis